MTLALVLLGLSALTGGLMLLDFLVLARFRAVNDPRPKWIEHAYSYFPVFFTVLIFRSFLVEPFRIPSGSLEPTLLVGDFVAVNKFAYGIRLPVLDKKIMPLNDPKVGDIAVFRWPPNPSFDFIKRVIGVPGDTIEYHDKRLTVNGDPAEQTFLEYVVDEVSGNTVAKYSENLRGVSHEIYVRPSVPASDFTIVVPENSYFMMGDNRDDSADSRYWGFVTDEYLRGKAVLTWMSWDSNENTIRFNRMGRMIH